MESDPEVGNRFCHVIVLDDDGTHVTATQTPCGWMLPLMPQPDSMPVESAYKAALTDLLDDEADDHRLIHCAKFQYPPGSANIHAYCLVQRRSRIAPGVHKGRWWTVASLLSRPSVFAEQTAILRLAMHRLAHPVGAFDACSAVVDMERWIHRILTEIDPADGLRDIVWRRRARNDAVGTCYTVRGNRMFVKGGTHRASQEAVLAETLNTCVPGCAPTTLALDRERGWWLVADAGGYQLPASHRTAVWYLKAIDTCTALQRALPRDCEATRLLAHRTADATTLAEMVPLVVEWGAAARVSKPGLLIPAALEQSLIDMLDRLAALNTSGYWVHFDLSFNNIQILRDGALCLVDLEYGCLGTPILSFGLLLQEATRRSRATARACQDGIVSLWAGGDRERWYASVRDLPVLSLLLKLYVLRQRQADYAADSVGAMDVLFRNTFVGLASEIVSLLVSHRVAVEV